MPKYDKKVLSKMDANDVEETFKASLKKLNIQSAYGLLVHDANSIFIKNGSLIIEKMKELKWMKVGKVSDSNQSEAQADELM